MTSVRLHKPLAMLDHAGRQWWVMAAEAPLQVDTAAHGFSLAPSRPCGCDYALEEGELRVVRVHLELTAGEVGRLDLPFGPRIAGKRPKVHSFGLAGEWIAEFEDLHSPSNYPGRLLACHGEVEDYSRDRPAYAFAQVLEMTFECGRIGEIVDRSSALQAFRASLPKNSDWDGQRIATTRDRERLRACVAGNYLWALDPPARMRWLRMVEGALITFLAGLVVLELVGWIL